MIYLDNSATTYPKPESVRRAVMQAMQTYGANPGRGGYRMSLKTGEQVYQCRKKLADFFHCPKEENVIFALNCTQCLNAVLKGYLKEGEHVVVSCMEHNAVMRPLEKLRQMGVNVTVAKVFPGDDAQTVDSFRQCMKSNTRLIVTTHVSNVWGIRLPIAQLADLAHSVGARILVDAAQSGGVLPIDMQKDGLDFVCLAAHKGLYGIMGVGVLMMRETVLMDTLIEGGTGSLSASLLQPEMYPDRLESGTTNVPGILSLSAGLDFISRKTLPVIYQHEMGLIRELYRGLSQKPRVKLYTSFPDEHYGPVLSFTCEGESGEETAARLAQKGIATRGGLHCAPMAHAFFGTQQSGTVRVSPSVFSVPTDVKYFLEQI